MRTAQKAWLLNVGLIAAMIYAYCVQARQNAELRKELLELRQLASERDKFTNANRRFREQQVAAEELKALRSDHRAVAELRAELARLKENSDGRLKSIKHSPEEPVLTKPKPKPEAGPLMAANSWRNAGRETPGATLETTFWAAAAGDVDALARGISLTQPKEIQTLLDKLPEAQRESFGTPERLVATLMAKYVRTQSIQVLEEKKDPRSPNLTLSVRLSAPDGFERQTDFTFSNCPDGWRINVPPHAVAGYVAHALNSTAEAASGK